MYMFFSYFIILVQSQKSSVSKRKSNRVGDSNPKNVFVILSQNYYSTILPYSTYIIVSRKFELTPKILFIIYDIFTLWFKHIAQSLFILQFIYMFTPESMPKIALHNWRQKYVIELFWSKDYFEKCHAVSSILCVQEVVTHFIIVSYYIKWGTTSWTYSIVYVRINSWYLY